MKKREIFFRPFLCSQTHSSSIGFIYLFFHLYQKDKGILSQIHFLGFKIIMEEENCETHKAFVDDTHKAFVDEAFSLPLIRFGLKCPPPNAHPFSLLLSISLMNFVRI